MRLARPLAIGAATLMVAGSTLFVSASASAADFYVDGDSLPSETNPYSAGWFVGTVATAPTLLNTPSGLSMTGVGASGAQILNGTTPDTDIVALVNGARLDTIGAGNAYFQIPVFFDADADPATPVAFTTLYPTNPGTAGLRDVTAWQTSRPITGGATSYAARDAAPLADLVSALGTGYDILAFGAYVNPGETATVARIDWAGNTHWFMPALAAPTATLSATSITVSQFAASGVTATFTGFIPGEVVDLGYGTGAMGGSIGTATADANGTVTSTFTTASTQTAAGVTYSLGATGAVSGASVFGQFALVEDAVVSTPVEPAAEQPAGELAFGGTDAAPAIAGGVALLVLGAGALVLARRRSSVA